MGEIKPALLFCISLDSLGLNQGLCCSTTLPSLIHHQDPSLYLHRSDGTKSELPGFSLIVNIQILNRIDHSTRIIDRYDFLFINFLFSLLSVSCVHKALRKIITFCPDQPGAKHSRSTDFAESRIISRPYTADAPSSFFLFCLHVGRPIEWTGPMPIFRLAQCSYGPLRRDFENRYQGSYKKIPGVLVRRKMLVSSDESVTSR